MMGVDHPTIPPAPPSFFLHQHGRKRKLPLTMAGERCPPLSYDISHCGFFFYNSNLRPFSDTRGKKGRLPTSSNKNGCIEPKILNVASLEFPPSVGLKHGEIRRLRRTRATTGSGIKEFSPKNHDDVLPILVIKNNVETRFAFLLILLLDPDCLHYLYFPTNAI